MFVLVLAAANMGVIRRDQDPIRDTQTDPILYKQKMEQEKDGVKGPLLYHVKYNPEDTFFIDPPYGKKTETLAGKEGISVKPAASTMNWWEEQPSTEEMPPPDGGLSTQPVTEEPAVSDEESLDEKIPDQATVNVENVETSKEEDYWW